MDTEYHSILDERVGELAIVCADLERRLASQIAANETLRAQLQEKWIRINELERNNALMAEQLIGNSQPADPLLHS